MTDEIEIKLKAAEGCAANAHFHCKHTRLHFSAMEETLKVMKTRLEAIRGE